MDMTFDQQLVIVSSLKQHHSVRCMQFVTVLNKWHWGKIWCRAPEMICPPPISFLENHSMLIWRRIDIDGYYIILLLCHLIRDIGTLCKNYTLKCCVRLWWRMFPSPIKPCRNLLSPWTKKWKKYFKKTKQIRLP